MIYLVTLEQLPNRYTTQWKEWIPKYFDNMDFIEIDGEIQDIENSGKTFLNFPKTSVWKSQQMVKISSMFSDGIIKDGDSFLFYDGWHIGASMIRYISKLGGINVKMYGMWHAGCYDPHDLLSQDQIPYFLSDIEHGLFKCFDINFVATTFHKSLILSSYPDIGNIMVTGFPFEFTSLDKFHSSKKEDIVIFPHRLSKEKQYVEFKDYIVPKLKSAGVKVVICQEDNLTKEEYYNILSKSKVVVSLALQETWGISIFESVYLGCDPILPNSLSYTEMYPLVEKIPQNINCSIKDHVDYIVEKILKAIANYNVESKDRKIYIDYLESNFCTFENIMKVIRRNE